jgi:hypothetical protein
MSALYGGTPVFPNGENYNFTIKRIITDEIICRSMCLKLYIILYIVAVNDTGASFRISLEKNVTSR